MLMKGLPINKFLKLQKMAGVTEIIEQSTCK